MSKVYIELSEAINAIKSLKGNCDNKSYYEGLTDACSELIGLERTNVAPVPARHGEWIATGQYDAHYTPVYQCSTCHKEVADNYIYCHKYCLHCGTHMN